MESIQQWYDNGQNYAEGVSIYRELPKRNANLLRLFNLNENKLRKEKLLAELSKYITIQAVPVTISVAEKTLISPVQLIEKKLEEVEKKQRVLFHHLPPELRDVMLRANELFRYNCFLKVELNDLPDDAEEKALDIQLRIADNFKENKACWSKIDYFLEHRELPKEASSGFEKLTASAMVKRQQQLFVSVSKKKKALKENRAKSEKTTSVSELRRLQKLITKQEKALLKYDDDLFKISKLINGR